MTFEIKTEPLSDRAFAVAIAGEVDLYVAPELKQQLLDVIERGATSVVVDLTDATFIDSTTLGVLIGAVRRLRANDGRLSVVCNDRNVARTFELSGLDRVFEIFPTREQAIARLDGGPEGIGVTVTDAVETRPGRKRPTKGVFAAVGLAVAFMASGCGAVAHMSATDGHAAAGKPLFKTNCASVPHARGRRRGRGDRPEPRHDVRHRQGPGLRRLDDPRRRARADRLSGDRERRRRPTDAGRPRDGPGREGRRRLRRRVRAASGGGRCSHGPGRPARRRTSASSSGRTSAAPRNHRRFTGESVAPARRRWRPGARRAPGRRPRA